MADRFALRTIYEKRTKMANLVYLVALKNAVRRLKVNLAHLKKTPSMRFFTATEATNIDIQYQQSQI